MPHDAPSTPGLGEAASTPPQGDPSLLPPTNRWLTIPNAVTLLRLLVCVPVTVWFIAQPDLQIAAAISLAVFGATDWIDGALARRLGQVSRVGEILDPVSDRVGIVLIGVALATFGYLPWIVVVTIAVCDLALGTIGLTRMSRVLGGHVNFVGKLRTAVLMAAMPLHLLSFAPLVPDEPLRMITFWALMAGTVLHVVAAGVYAARYLTASTPDPRPPAQHPAS
ncbi:phosphatidylglycerophosphate synthase [Pseudoclavibacter endophyticus]|uniref:CDP-alcohol phosphatidyltransferase family protein n=1 Tax=Pseudoclavibacter endophyticus TaxID=1778590 RepID=A0A6H9WM83_9MICO|nr:CDP-alcohol phosphatidyltransferase family protein [Pseudoclavibacter endophyticus]KAB1650273.1 CDP-alcohol phosphatidyltransferase family protein [Pseudoclavibacter endophyticus]GGA55596.1 phosphatidylglycerophosphate synthase [Pseudoclavibacter endophyticus]